MARCRVNSRLVALPAVTLVVLAVAVWMILAAPICTNCKSEKLQLDIIHLNDFHARFEETNWDGGVCGIDKSNCVGGIARIATKIKELLDEKPDAIVLNAGDNFQGTFYYNFYRWNITAEFMNRLSFDAVTIGNHEFDNGVDGLVPFLENLNASVVVSNMDVSEEPALQNLFEKSTIIERKGQKIGIIGYILKTTNEISNTGKVMFEDEIKSVSSEASILREQGVNIIIGLSHAGIEIDKIVAEKVEDIDIIVGGHSHTLLYSGTPPGGDVAFDSYPITVTQEIGRKVLIVQAGALSKYLGSLSVTFDENGEVLSSEGNPILLDSTVKPDEATTEALQPWKVPLQEIANKVVGSTKAFLNATKGACYAGECNIGSFLSDAMVYEHVGSAPPGSWTRSAIAFTNSGGIRASIDETIHEGNITYSDLITVAPFENTIDTVDLSGNDLLAVLEQSVSRASTARFLQFSGLRVEFDINNKVGKRVVSAEAVCSACRVPTFEPIKHEEMYKITIPSFLYGGGDGYTIFKSKGKNHEVGRLDREIFLDYLKARNYVTQGIDGRIKIVQKSQ